LRRPTLRSPTAARPPTRSLPTCFGKKTSVAGKESEGRLDQTSSPTQGRSPCRRTSGRCGVFRPEVRVGQRDAETGAGDGPSFRIHQQAARVFTELVGRGPRQAATFLSDRPTTTNAPANRRCFPPTPTPAGKSSVGQRASVQNCNARVQASPTGTLGAVLARSEAGVFTLTVATPSCSTPGRAESEVRPTRPDGADGAPSSLGLPGRRTVRRVRWSDCPGGVAGQFGPHRSVVLRCVREVVLRAARVGRRSERLGQNARDLAAVPVRTAVLVERAWVCCEP